MIDSNRYFVGSPYVQMDYTKQYSQESTPAIWYIDKVIREAGLQTKKPKGKKKKGGSEYLLYPVERIKQLGYVQQSADFIGKKYITGRTEPINIFSSSYYSPFKLYKIKRVLAEKAPCAIEEIKQQWQKYPIPNVFRIDNGLQFRGTARGKRAIGMFLRFLLNLNVTPVFGSPSKPWTNPHIEGHNRVFNDKVWGNNFFTGLEQIDRECERFNQESLEFFQYKYSQLIFNGNFGYLETEQKIIIDKLMTVRGKKIYFIRFVESRDKDRKANITILNEIVYLPEKYNHQFVFVEWNIGKEQLLIYSEYKREITLIRQIKFRLNI
ncbi:hypothetical protein L6279_05300 [Candidatus Parcubacteria bacterium]|nr:hypothetical protein [Candidatus Parcubacteria bacterium]